MERLVISVSAQQAAWLKQEAARRGITVSEVLRRIIDSAKEGKK